MGNYRRIYPVSDSAEKYDKFFTQSGTLYSETAASKARIEQAKYVFSIERHWWIWFFCFFRRAQLDELQRKQDQLNSYKNGKPTSTPSVPSREAYGESPTKKTLPVTKSSRSSSFNRPLMKRLTAVISTYIFQFNLLLVRHSRVSIFRYHLRKLMVIQWNQLKSKKVKKSNASHHWNIEKH